MKDWETLSDSQATSEKKRNRILVINLPRKDKVSFCIGTADTTEHCRVAKENRKERNITYSSRNDVGWGVEWPRFSDADYNVKQTILPSFYFTSLWKKYINNNAKRVSRTTSMPKCWLTLKMLLLKMEDCCTGGCTVTERIQGKFKKSKWQKSKDVVFRADYLQWRLPHVTKKAQPTWGRKEKADHLCQSTEDEKVIGCLLWSASQRKTNKWQLLNIAWLLLAWRREMEKEIEVPDSFIVCPYRWTKQHTQIYLAKGRKVKISKIRLRDN